MSFQVREALPGIFHIKDSMGVCMTLLTGTQSALLFDTGYGFEDVSVFARALTGLPLQVVLSHGHHDHSLGARWFSKVSVLEAELETVREYTGDRLRRKVLLDAENAGVLISAEDQREYLTAQMPDFECIREGTIELGGLSAQIIACPGHTPGSAVIYVPERKLLLTGDDWNPCTWVFFPEALTAVEYRSNVSRLLALPFEHILCPHTDRTCSREEFELFINGLTDEALENAPDSPEGDAKGIRTAKVSLKGEYAFVFDRDRIR